MSLQHTLCLLWQCGHMSPESSQPCDKPTHIRSSIGPEFQDYARLRIIGLQHQARFRHSGRVVCACMLCLCISFSLFDLLILGRIKIGEIVLGRNSSLRGRDLG